MSLLDVINNSRERSRPTPKLKELNLHTPPPSTTRQFVPASDKTFAVDKSSDLKVVRRPEVKTSKDFSVWFTLTLTKLKKKYPNWTYKGYHSANVFTRQSCYLFFDETRKITLAMSAEELKQKLSRP